MYWPIRCFNCGREFERSGRKRYCCNACRQADYRARRTAKVWALDYCGDGSHLEYYSEVYSAYYDKLRGTQR